MIIFDGGGGVLCHIRSYFPLFMSAFRLFVCLFMCGLLFPSASGAGQIFIHFYLMKALSDNDFVFPVLLKSVAPINFDWECPQIKEKKKKTDEEPTY